MAWSSLPAVVSAGAVTIAWGQAVSNDIAACPAAVVTTQGDTVYATDAHALSRLGIGAADRVYTSTGLAPAWVDSLKPRQPYCRARLTSSHDISGTTWTPVPFDAADSPNGTLWDAGSPTRVTVSVTGLYLVVGAAYWSYESAAFNVACQLRVNAVANSSNLSHIAVRAEPTYFSAPAHGFNALVALNASDYLEMQVWHSIGGVKSLLAGSCLTVQLLGKAS